jgi:hypothetical protein
VGHHQVPAIAKHLLNRPLHVPAWIAFALQQVAAPCVVAIKPEGVTHPGAVFTGNKDFHKKAPLREKGELSDNCS